MLSGIAVSQIEKGKWNIGACVSQNVSSVAACFFGTFRIPRAGAEFTQGLQAPLAGNPAGGLGDDAEYAAYSAALVANGIIGNVEVGFFQVPEAFHQEQAVARME